MFKGLKDIGNKKISLVHLKELLKLHIKLYYRLFISCLVFKIFPLKKVSCSPSWIIEDMHVTSREGSCLIFYLESKLSIWVQKFISGCCLKFRND